MGGSDGAFEVYLRTFKVREEMAEKEAAAAAAAAAQQEANASQTTKTKSPDVQITPVETKEATDVRQPQAA